MITKTFWSSDLSDANNTKQFCLIDNYCGLQNDNTYTALRWNGDRSLSFPASGSCWRTGTVALEFCRQFFKYTFLFVVPCFYCLSQTCIFIYNSLKKKNIMVFHFAMLWSREICCANFTVPQKWRTKRTRWQEMTTPTKLYRQSEPPCSRQ